MLNGLFPIRGSDRAGYGAPAQGRGRPGKYTLQSGMLAYHEICANVKQLAWTEVAHTPQRGPFAHKGDQWVGYDDPSMAKVKAEYAVANRLTEEPAFNWWVPQTLRRRNRIISKVKNKYWRTTQKFGIKLPHSVEEALEIDRITGTDFWTKAINKEMSKVKCLFKI